MITLYGIKNCDTVRKARAWLELNGIDYAFHDFREDGLDRNQLQSWLDELGWETLINRRSTTWKQLDPETRESMDRASAMAAALEQPTLIKRPVLDTGASLHVGFKPADYAKFFEKHTL